jgi:chromosome segregation ATPase
MWSQFVARKEVVTTPSTAGAEQEISPSVTVAPSPITEDDDEQINNTSQDNNNNNNNNNNGWNDDSFDMEEEEFNTIIDGERSTSVTATATDDPNDNTNTTLTFTDGWDDSLLDNDDLNNNSPPETIASADYLQTSNNTAAASVAGGGTLGKAAETFGAALLASLDDEEEVDRQQQQQQQTSGRGGFRAGFVIKGLTRFIEAATAPQEDYDDEEEDGEEDIMNDGQDGGGGGWDDDDDNLEMGDDDDFDFNHQDDKNRDEDVVNDDDQGDYEESGNFPIIQNVAEEEEEDDDDDEEEIMAQENGWDDDIDVNDSTFESGVIISDETQEVEDSNDGRLDSGDNNNNNNNTNQWVVNNYEMDKDKSPEPVVKHDDDAEKLSSSLPHQESWYINAMEGGQGGVVYAEKSMANNNNVDVPLEHVQELIDTVAETESVLLPAEVASNVGMPISEMPSANTSPRSNSDENIAPITQCELKCECLELIMPLPDNGVAINGSPPENDGFGTKKLPDGTTVLVNYEQLLLNEATKRILLERTIESYERTIAKLESKHQVTLQLNVEHEEKENTLNSQLAFVNNENAELKTLVSHLQLEKEQPQSESHLFEAELSAACNEKDRLQNEVMSLQEELKSKEAETQSLQSSLAEVQKESMKLKSENEMLQRECDELQDEVSGKSEEVFQLSRQSSQNFADKTTQAVELTRLQEHNVTLKGKIEILQKELDSTAEENDQLNEENEQLKFQVSQSFANHSSKAVEYERTCSRLENKLSEANVQLSTLRDENEELRNIQRESDAQIIELRATIESMDGEDGEATHLVADIANLRYELEAKVAECGESAAEKNRMEHELTEAKAELTTLREQNDELRVTVESINGDPDEVNDLVAEVANLKYELEAKVAECGESIAEKSQLETILTDLRAELTTLRDENESLRNMQRDSDAKINELRARIESMDGDSGEVNQLVAEVANLKYELEAKVAECGESTTEKSRMEMELSETNAEVTTLKEENESLRNMQRDSDAQINELRATIESMDGDSGEVNQLVAEIANLKYELEAKVAECGESTTEKSRMEMQLSETNAELTALKEENESLRNMQRDSDAQINELRATIESMGDASEVNQLVAEVANLKYELEAKATERNDNMNALQALQAKLDNAEECLKETMNASDGDAEDALKAENYELSRKLVDLQSNLDAVENSRSDLQLALEEKTRASESFETQINSLNAQLLEASQLQQTLSVLRKALEDKSQECEVTSSKVDELQVALGCAQTNHDKVIKESSDQSNDQISKLQAQIASHKVTMQGLADRLIDASNQITNLSAQCDDYRQKLEYSQSECARFADNISKLENEKVQLSSALESVNSALEENQMEASRNNSSIEMIKGEMESITTQNKELIERNQVLLQEKNDAVKALDAKTSELEQEATRSNMSIEMIKEEMESIMNQNKELIERKQVLLQEKADAVKALLIKTSELEQEKNLFETSHKANSVAQQSILDLEKQLQDLKTTNKRLESELFEASFAADDNEALMKERDDLAQEVQVLRDQLNDLSSPVANASYNNEAFSSVERESLLARISKLESELCANENVADLRDELTSIQEERDQLDLDNEELLVQLGLMQQDKLENEAARQVEIDGLREQVSNLKEKCDRLQNDLRCGSSSLSEDNHHEVVERLREEIRQLKENSATLSKDISLSEDNHHEVVECLREEIRQLKENSATLSKDISLLKLKLADKDGEVLSIKEQMEHALNEKDEEIGKLRAAEQQAYTEETNEEVEGESYDQDQYQAYVKTEEEKEFYSGDEDDDIVSLQGLLAEEADSDDFLRSQIVILAQALERAELHRAEVLERIISERKSNADIVSQLGLSVKRFYSTIRRSDGP